MDPNRPRTPEELALEAEASRESAEPPAGESRAEPPTEAVADDQVADADATSGSLDPAELFGSFDVGLQVTADAIPDASVEHRSKEVAADNVAPSADTLASDAAFSPPSIDETAAAFRAPPIADLPAVTLAREMIATWQDLSAEFDSERNDATADRRESAATDLPMADSDGDAESLNFGGFIETEPVEPPSGANEDFDTFDRTPRANPADYIAIGNFLGPSNDPTVIQRGPLRTDDDSWRTSIKLLSETSGDAGVQERPSDAELTPRATALQSPTSDGGPPLARPILMASIPEEQTRRILDEALAEAGRRDAKTAAEVAQQQVDDAFWLRACEERALYRGR